MDINRNDYVVINRGRKKTLCFILNPKSRTAVVESTLSTDDPEQFNYEDEDVVANLGQDPSNGKVHGLTVEPYIKTISTKKYGPIEFYRKMDRNETKAFQNALKSAYEIFKAESSVGFLPVSKIVVRPSQGKYAGSYKASVKGGEIRDEVRFYPETFSDEIYNLYIICHEFAHGLWYRCVPHKLRSKWINLYQKRVTLSKITARHLEDLCKSLLDHSGGIADYRKEVADEEEKAVIKEVLSYFKKYHSMDVTSLDLLLGYDSGSLVDMWPTAAMLSESKPDISVYSMKNPEEFFAEAVAYRMTSKKLPKDVEKALTATFQRCTAPY